MGSAASFYEQPPEVQKEIYRVTPPLLPSPPSPPSLLISSLQKIAELYDEEYLPRLENNDLVPPLLPPTPPSLCSLSPPSS